MAKVVIFGVEDFAQLAHFYLSRDSEHEVVAFTMHESYLNTPEFMGLPVVRFEEVETLFPSGEYAMFVPMSPAKMNTLRAEVYTQAKGKGYTLVSYISSKATYYDTPVGENCFIFENNVIQPFAEIGNNVIMWSGNHFGHHSVIGDHCFVASHVVISGHVTINEHCFFGVNATVSNNIVVARHTFVGAGALIAENTQEFGVYPGTKAVISRVPSNKLRGM
jgi:sugar O-acyltransferase (sialic acid O-acetyltransferase NeuD family)